MWAANIPIQDHLPLVLLQVDTWLTNSYSWDWWDLRSCPIFCLGDARTALFSKGQTESQAWILWYTGILLFGSRCHPSLLGPLYQRSLGCLVGGFTQPLTSMCPGSLECLGGTGSCCSPYSTSLPNGVPSPERIKTTPAGYLNCPPQRTNTWSSRFSFPLSVVSWSSPRNSVIH